MLIIISRCLAHKNILNFFEKPLDKPPLRWHNNSNNRKRGKHVEYNYNSYGRCGHHYVIEGTDEGYGEEKMRTK